MTRRLFLLGIVCVFAAALPTAWAEVRGQAEGLFWLDVPEGWLWTEDKGQVMLSEFNGTDRILIRFERIDGYEGSQRTLVQEARDDRRREVAQRNGKSVMKVERQLDGAYALQTGFLIFTPAGMRQATSLVFFHDSFLFDVYLEAPREIFRLEMERILDTWRFEKPEEPSDEEAASPDEAPAGADPPDPFATEA